MNVFDRTTLGGLELKNRIFRSATNEHVSNSDGTMSEELIRVYEELARGGVGTIITGHYCVIEGERVSINQPLGLPVNAAKMKEAVDRVKAIDPEVRMVMQLSGGGTKAPEEVNGKAPRRPEDYTPEDLAEFRRAFVRSAKLAKEAGFDGVQIHLAHGYMLSGFLDPAENHRTDEYGGNASTPEGILAETDDRFRLCGEIIRGILQELPGYPVFVKVNADAGIPMDYVPVLHRVLELCREAGVIAAEVSGLSFAAHKPDCDEPYFLKEALEAGRGVDLPLILVGGLDSRAKMQQVLDAGIPYVSLSRAFICQPDFVNRLQEGAETSPCLRCFGCFRVFRTKYTRCVLHDQEIPRLRECFGKKA